MAGDRPLRLAGGRLLDPSDGLDRVGDLCLLDGRVAGIDLPPHGDEHLVDVEGCWVTPGFVDLHTHLREPGQAHKETIASGTRAAAAGGFTTVCAMANTEPVVDRPDLVRWVADEAAAVAPIEVLPVAAVTEGLAGRRLTDQAALQAAGACAFSDDGAPLLDPDVLEGALRRARDLGAVISVHAEDTSRGAPGIDARIAAELGCAGIPADAEVDLLTSHLEVLARVPGARLHVAHLTTARGVALVRDARASGLRVTCEVTPHHLWWTYDVLRHDRFGSGGDPFAKVNPPLRDAEDRRALRAALADGTIQAIATDHAPHTVAEKAVGLAGAPSGLTGLELVVPTVVGLVAAGQLRLGRAVSALTTDAAACFGLRPPGLRPGSVADVAVVNPDQVWPVSTTTLRSRGANTPALGTDVRGGVRLTVRAGRIVHPEVPR